MKLPNEEPMNLVKDRTPETPDTGQEAAEIQSDKDLEKIALASGGPDLKGKYHDKQQNADKTESGVPEFLRRVPSPCPACGTAMRDVLVTDARILWQCPTCKSIYCTRDENED